MARAIIAVIVSYIILFALMILTFNCVYWLIGADSAFKPGSYEASNLWLAIAFAANLVMGIIAGLICVAITKGGKAPVALAIVVLVLGLLLGVLSIMSYNARPNKVRAGNPSAMEAMQRAKQPIWAPLLFPFAGAVGVLIGGRLKRRG